MFLYVFYKDILFVIVSCIFFVVLDYVISFSFCCYYSSYHSVLFPVVFLVYVVLLLVLFTSCLVLFIFRCVLCLFILEFLE
jgi:hypothetical protein